MTRSTILEDGDFHFLSPVQVSKAVLTFLNQLVAIISKGKNYLDARGAALAHEDHESSRLVGRRANSLRLSTAIMELVPRLLISYTSLVPCFFGAKLDKDLYLACEFVFTDVFTCIFAV